VPVLLALAACALVFGCVAGYWRKQWTGITDELRRKTILAHNNAQNAILSAATDELRLAKEQSCAHKLKQFVAIKQKIEARIHEDGAITGQKVQIEQLVDSLCFGVRDQLVALVLKQSNGEKVDRKAVLQRVDAAFETLQSTAADLDTILGPTDAPAGTANASLEEITRRLREEGEIARRVQARLQAQEGSSPAVEQPRSETE
jgi:hypothetical protein